MILDLTSAIPKLIKVTSSNNPLTLFCSLLILAVATGAQPDGVDLQFTSQGLQSIRYDGAELLARNTFDINAVSFATPDNRLTPGNTKHSISFDQATRTGNLVFDWGSIAVQYVGRPEKVVINIVTTNRSKLPLQALSYDALALRLPSHPVEYNGVMPMLATNIGSPTMLPLTSGSTLVLLCNEDVRRPLLIGFPWSLDKPQNRTFPLRINTGRDAMYPDSLPAIDRPIAPGATDRFSLSLRFATASTGLAALAPDLLELFQRFHPFTLKWPDRRPIGSLIMATSATNWPTNPRGWLLDPQLDVKSKEGRAAFRVRLLAWADRSIAILKQMNAQGMVTWDIEGEQFPHPTTYLGDPRLFETLAPEMAGLADEYFARFTRAGLRVGVTVRPQTVAIGPDKSSAHQLSSADPAQVLIDKIRYARKRWGATLFYIDSNGDPVLPLSFDVISRVAAAVPDVLLMPEHKNAAYYSATAPYSELRGGVTATPELAREIYRHAFSVINTADGRVDQNYLLLQKAVERGDILMFRAWFDDPANAKIKRLTAGCAKSHFD